MSSDFASHLRTLIEARGVSYRQLAAATYYSKSHVHDLATGRKQPTAEAARRLDAALHAGGELVTLIRGPGEDDELAALELARRVDASDTGDETLTGLELAFDELASAYTAVPLDHLLPRIKRHLDYAGRLLEGRTTLSQHRRLLLVNAWLSLLAATVHIDLRNHAAARARLTAAAQIARHTDHSELRAWCIETRAWEVMTTGDYAKTVHLSRQAQEIAPVGSDAFIQATAQEGRAQARMHDLAATRKTLDRVAQLVAAAEMPDRPEHHYRYDPSKAISYTATTLAWAGDPAAEMYARHIIDELERGDVLRPRRIASARLDLSLALLAGGQPDEATAVAVQAVESGCVVPSNWWRATEVLAGVERTGIPEAADLREVYVAHRPVR